MEKLNNNIAHLAVSSVCHSAFPPLLDLSFTDILGGFIQDDISCSMKELLLRNKQRQRVQ